MLDERFTDAVGAMYDHAMADPISSDNGQITDVAFSSTASIFAWVMMNTKNPDLPFFLDLLAEARAVPNGQSTIFLPNTAIVEIKGNPTDGWTLVSWDGQPVPEDPGLLTKLLMDLRDLISTPQTAAWNIYEAALGGDPVTIEAALTTGLQNVGTAIIQFPENLFDDIVGALQNLGAAAGGQAAGEATTLGRRRGGIALSQVFSSAP